MKPGGVLKEIPLISRLLPLHSAGVSGFLPSKQSGNRQTLNTTGRRKQMEKKVLVAFDDSDNARRAVEFIARSFTTDHHITLFSVIPDTTALCQMTGFNTPTLTPYF